MMKILFSHQSSRAADLLFDVVHQETKDALVLFSSLVNATGRQLKHKTHRHRNTCEELRCWLFKVLTCQVCEKASPNTSSERRICAL